MPPRGRKFPRRFILRGGMFWFVLRHQRGTQALHRGMSLAGVSATAALFAIQMRSKLDAGRGDDQTEWRVVEVRVN
jgi:hypothetical protein